MARLRYNGLSTTLGGSLTNSATSVTFAAALTHSGGTNVPTISSDYIPLSILDPTTGRLSEIVYLTAYTSGATTGTISRGQEGTTGVAHASGDKVIHSGTVLDSTRRAFGKTGSGGGVLSTTSTTMVDATGLTIDIPCEAGDVLVATFVGSVYSTNAGNNVEAAINIGGTDRVNNLCVAAASSAATPFTILVPAYVVTSGDIVSGLVTVKVRWKTSAFTGYMLNNGGWVPQLGVIRLGGN